MLEIFSRVEFKGLYLSLKKKKRKESRLVFTFSMKREIKTFDVVVVPLMAKKCAKIRIARAKLLFA